MSAHQQLHNYCCLMQRIRQRSKAPLPMTWKKSIDEINDDENRHRFYEIIYVGDHLIAEQIGLMELPDMLLIIANIVSNHSLGSCFFNNFWSDYHLTYKAFIKSNSVNSLCNS